MVSLLFSLFRSPLPMLVIQIHYERLMYMPRITRKETDHRAYKLHFDYNNWEGGLAVFVMDSEYGTRCLAIPRLGISTILLGNGHDNSQVVNMLRRDKNFYHEGIEKCGEFADMIMNEIKRMHLARV